MKRGGWGWSPTEAFADRTVLLAILLVALPLCVFVAASSWRAFYATGAEPIQGVERWIEPLPAGHFDTAGFTLLSRQRPDLDGVTWEAVSLPLAVAAPPLADLPTAAPMARVWLRTTYLPIEDGQLAIYVPRVMGGAYSVWVNGRLIDANLTDWRMQWNEPLFVKLPADSIWPVTIEIAVPYRLAQGYAIGSIYVGPASAIENIYHWRVFWQVLLPKTSILITLILGLLALAFWRSLPEERGYLYMGLSALAWFVANTQYLGDFLDDQASQWFGFLNDNAIGWSLAFLCLFAMQFARERSPRLEVLLITYAAGMTIITLPIWQWDAGGLILQHYFDLAVAFSAFGYLSWQAIRSDSHEFRVSMAAIWSMPLMGVHTLFYLTSQRAPDLIHLFPYSSFIVFGAFLYVMQRRYLQARQALLNVNASLDARLQTREADLALQHQQLLAIEQQRVLTDERQRLMRDMHDGIGSTLMTSLTAAEHGQLDAAGSAAVLRECLDDLKLVIDSLEPVDHDLATLLGNLRYRFGHRLEAAGIRIKWQVGELPPLPWLDPGHALQVLRIVQEALTNVLKHVRASQVVIEARLDEAGRAVVIRVSDNGVGFDVDQARPGRGLGNLHRRAALLGGELAVNSAAGRGTTVELRLPMSTQVR
jgi:signal transduction histidine kinase